MNIARISILLFLCLYTGLLPLDLNPAHAQEPVLESYSLSHGGTPAGPPEGIAALLHDKYFGEGTAQASIRFFTQNKSSCLDIHVWRTVWPGKIVFALLVLRVEIQGLDALGETIYSRDLDGFTFGDNSAGNWSTKLQDLPADIQQIQVVFVGNYE